MTRQHTNSKTNANEIIVDFLEGNPTPTREQWKSLIEKYRDISGDIADAAMLNAGINFLTEGDEEAPLNTEAFNATISQAINLVHTTPSPTKENLESKVAEIRGPAVRKIAGEIGLPYAPVLLNSILTGTVKAPWKLICRMAEKFGTEPAALQEFLKHNLKNQPIPAFKSDQGKPQVTLTQLSWEEAVTSLKLPENQTKELLALEE